MEEPVVAGPGACLLEEEVTKSCRDRHGRWTNPWPTWRFPSRARLLKFLLWDTDNSNVPTSKEAVHCDHLGQLWAASSQRNNCSEDVDVLLNFFEVLDEELPVQVPYFARGGPVDSAPPGRGLRVTWLGHATTLVELDGLSVLTDPVFSLRASPVQFMGPKRYRGPPCTVEQLPPIDAVVISHNHYDHLDQGTVNHLNARFGADLHWFVPLGLADWLGKAGCQNVMELDWWEENCVPGHPDTTFVCTPAQHWSKRTPLDNNQALWGSWSILGPQHRFFFAGDTGYCSSFAEIGRRYGPFDLAAIPIGAYLPRDVMLGQHVDPEEAVQIHEDVRAKHSVGVHWGTFALAHEPYLEPPVRLRQALERKGLQPGCFFTLQHGESRTLQ